MHVSTLVLLQIRSLRGKLTDSRSAVEQLTSQLSSVKLAAHEREAELSVALRASGERSLASLLGECACLPVCLSVRLSAAERDVVLLSSLTAAAFVTVLSAGSPTPAGAAAKAAAAGSPSPTRTAAAAAALPGALAAGLPSPSRAATLAAAFVGVRQRQQRYLHDAGLGG